MSVLSSKTARPLRDSGMLIALLSALAFGTSGPFAKSLLEAGWSPSAATLVRIGGGALLLLPATVRAWRRAGVSPANRRTVLLYGVVAVAGAQVCYFSAVQTLSIGVALLLEYLAPVLMVGLAWARSGTAPPVRTLTGTAVSMVGLVLVLDLTGAVTVDLVGVLWGLGAAVCLCGYFLISARLDGVPAIVAAGGGLTVGSAAVALLGLSGVLPLIANTQPVQLLGATTSWIVPVVFLVVVSSALAYTTGVVAVWRLGSTVASFVGLTEVLFAILTAWVLLGQLPGLVQLVGGILILCGVVLIQRGNPPHRSVTDHDASQSSGKPYLLRRWTSHGASPVCSSSLPVSVTTRVDGLGLSARTGSGRTGSARTGSKPGSGPVATRV